MPEMKPMLTDIAVGIVIGASALLLLEFTAWMLTKDYPPAPAHEVEIESER